MIKKPSPGKNRFIRNPDVVLREEDPEGALLFNPDTNQIRVINATGLFIWKHCDGKKDLPTIIAAMKKVFDRVPDKEVETHANDFLDDMKVNCFLIVPETKEKEI